VKNKKIVNKIDSFFKSKNITKKKLIGFGVGILCIILLLVVGTNYNKFAVKKVVNNYFDDLTSLKLEESKEYLNRTYDYSNNDSFNLENFKLYVEKWQVSINSVKIKDKTAIVELDIYQPNTITMFLDYAAEMFNNVDKNKFYKEKLEDPNLEYTNNIGVIVLNKVKGKWKINVDSNFQNVINYGANNEKLDINEENNKNPESTNHQISEEEMYIAKYLKINNYKIKKFTNYSYERVPGISDIAIKNSGNKDISNLTITVYFQDKSGKDIAEDEFMIIGNYDEPSPLKANYSWKMEKDKFYEFTNLSEEVDLSRNKVKITEIEFDSEN